MLKLDVSTDSTRIQDLPGIDLEVSDKLNIQVLTADDTGHLCVTPLTDVKRLSKVSIDSLTDVLQPKTIIGSYNSNNYTEITLGDGFTISDTGVLDFTMTYDTDLDGHLTGTLMSPVIDFTDITYQKFTGFIQNTLTGRVSADVGNMETILLGDNFHIDSSDSTLKVRPQSSINNGTAFYENKTDDFVVLPAGEYTVDALFAIDVTLDNDFKNGDYFTIIPKSPHSIIIKTPQENIVLERRDKRIYKFIYADNTLIEMLP